MTLISTLYEGVDLDAHGTGGPHCLKYLSNFQKIIETIFVSGVFTYLSFWSMKKIKIPLEHKYNRTNDRTRIMLLVTHCLVFGVEVGFKLATKSAIWILNPCHVLTIVQIWLLSTTPNALVTAVYRLHVHMLNGPLLAILFPVLNTRLLPFQHFLYYLQHVLILAIPTCIMDPISAYSVEPVSDLSWCVLSMSLQMLYHFLFLQPIAMVTTVNLNNIICPAVSDPFACRYYRLLAMIHQSFLIIFFGKMYSILSLKYQKMNYLKSIDLKLSISLSKIASIVYTPKQIDLASPTCDLKPVECVPVEKFSMTTNRKMPLHLTSNDNVDNIDPITNPPTSLH